MFHVAGGQLGGIDQTGHGDLHVGWPQGSALALLTRDQSIGTVGVLVLAKQKHGLAAIKPLLDQLTQSGYFLGDKLITEALAAAGEG